MAYVIAEPCIDVLALPCVSASPSAGVHYEEGVDRKLFIDPNECIDCGACEPECPVNAIFPEDQLPAEWAHYTQTDATWFTDRAPAPAPARGRRWPQAPLAELRLRAAVPPIGARRTPWHTARPCPRWLAPRSRR